MFWCQVAIAPESHRRWNAGAAGQFLSFKSVPSYALNSLLRREPVSNFGPIVSRALLTGSVASAISARVLGLLAKAEARTRCSPSMRPATGFMVRSRLEEKEAKEKSR